MRSLKVFLLSTLVVVLDEAADRAELNADDRDVGLSLVVAAESALGRRIPVAVLALLSEMSAPRTPLSIPSRTRDGEFGRVACIRLVGEALTSTWEAHGP